MSLVHSCSIAIYFPYLKLSIVDYHSYADEIQLYCRLVEPNNYIHLLNNCITDIGVYILGILQYILPFKLPYMTGSSTTPYH